MNRRNARLIYVFLIFGIFAVILNIIDNYANMGGDWATVSSAYIQTIPYLGIMGVGLYWAVIRSGGFIGTSLTFGLIGILNAGLFNHLNTNGIWIDAWVDATTTITDIMIMTVLIWIVFGFIVGASRR